MRYGIFSDVHSNLEALDAVTEAYQKEGIDSFLCIGDIVGYAANPIECAEKIKTIASNTVAGNHDWAAVDLFSLEYFIPAAREALLWTKKRLTGSVKYFLESLKLTYENQDLVLAHGTLHEPDEFNYLIDEDSASLTFSVLKGRICFVGHTHRPGIFVKDYLDSIHYKDASRLEIKDYNKYIVNVGSVGQPRDGNPLAAYCIYDTDKSEVQIKRISYDIETARKKIISAGLPKFLGDRLLTGR